MLANAVHHVSFAARDLARTQRFYGELLGLEEIERPDLGFPGVWYRSGGVEVHILGVPEGVSVGEPPEKLTPLANHLAFAIDDYAACAARLREAGLEVMGLGPERGQMWVQDPDGNVIELIEVRR